MRASALVLSILLTPGIVAANEITVRFEFKTVVPLITTGLGYEVRLTKGHIASFSVSLVPCAGGNRVRHNAGFFISSAQAGHGRGLLPHQLIRPVAEGLHRPRPRVFGKFTPPDQAYCKVHYVVAGVRQLGGLSMRLKGVWRRPLGAWHPFHAKSAANFGAFLSLTGSGGGPHWNTVSGFRTLTLTRDLSRLFQGVRFAEWDASALRKRILRNFVNYTSVRLER